MPPKARITRDMVVDAAFEIARIQGAESINARTVSEKLGCSTQPVMYHFKTIEALKKAAYQKADAFHSAFIAQTHSGDPIKDIGLNYICFATEEKNLFRFLFQSDSFSGSNLFDLINAEEMQPMIEMLRQEAGIRREQAKTVFRAVFLCVHGYASLLANNDIACDEERISADLDVVFCGAIGVLKEEMVEYETSL